MVGTPYTASQPTATIKYKMKSKYRILIHVLFWIYIINQALFPVYLNKIDKSKEFSIEYIVVVKKP